MARAVDDHIFLIIGDKALTLKDIGAAADMRLDAGFQSIIDQGLLGPEYVGVPWYKVIKTSAMQLESAPEPGNALLYTLYERYRVHLNHCRELSADGTLTQEDKDLLIKLRKDWRAAEKLAKD